MASIAPTQPVQEIPAQRAPVSEPGPAAEAAQRRIADDAAAKRNALMPDNVAIALDADAQRFVSTLTDNTTSEMLRRYPSESQLAYSRAVMAYLRAQLAK